jgi:sialidase-1
MARVEILDHHVVYDNPISHVRSRHGYFPGVVKLPSGDLLALFALGEALDAANVTTHVTRSTDEGRTWDLEGPLHERDPDHQFDSDYLKPTVLGDGSVIATGYRFHRTDPDQCIANPDGGGLRDGDNLVCHSRDEGRSWSPHTVIPRTRPELVEASGPSLQLRNGTLLVAGELFPRWDGSQPSGHCGALLRSKNGGVTWDDSTLFYGGSLGTVWPSEPRLCEMQDGKILCLFWACDHGSGTNLPNHVVVSRDGGESWSAPVDTGIPAQASNLFYLGGEMLLTIHCHREGETGLYARIVDFTGDQWRTVEEEVIWGNTSASKVGQFADMAKQLKFGQPSLLPLENGEFLATHWAVEDGQGKILTHRLHVDPT